MRLQSRYVEYSSGKLVCAGNWQDHRGGNCPEGCLCIGIPLAEARKWKKKFEEEERKQGCSNFEYRIVV